MIINIKDTLNLDDDNEYVVISKINYENKYYYYLIDKNVNTNVKFCYQDNDELVEINDKNLITKLLPLFLEVLKKEFKYKKIHLTKY